MNILSKYLGREVEIKLDEKQTLNEELVNLIPHCELTDLFDELQQEFGLRYILSEPYCQGNRIIYHCRMTDKSGKDITEVGESVPGSLHNQIAKDYAATMAAKRAFDAAFIRFLRLDCKKVYSAEAGIKTVDETEVVPADTEPTPTPAPTANDAVITSTEIAPDADELALESVPVEAEPVAEVMPAPEPEEVAVTEEAPVPAEGSDAGLPEDLILDFGKHKGKMFSEVYASDPDWVSWTIENLKANSPCKQTYLQMAKAKRAKEGGK